MAECKIISHRGANRHAPQNTLPAFEKSLEIGVDGFETDIHVTKDGIPVVCHNYTVDETSSGTGEIADMTLAELEALDFGAYFSPDFAGTKIPTLEQFLTLAEKADIEIMNIELKKPRHAETGIVQKTIAAAKAHGVFDKLLISSFDPKLLIEAKKIDGRCKTAFLYSPNEKLFYQMWYRAAKYARRIGADALHPHYGFVNKRYVEKAHKLGVKVNVWTVDNEKAAKRLVSIGVDGLITDCPEMAKKMIKEYAVR